MKTRRIDNMISILFLLSLFLPIIAYFNCKHHDCINDECMRIFYRGKLGICVENAIDTTCLTMAIGVWFIAYGSAIVWSKQKNTVSPIVIMALIELLAVYLAFVDPSKWLFAISMLIPFVIITIARSIDNRRVMEEKK